MTNHVTLTDGLHWLSDCHVDGDRHTHVSQYLIEGSEGTMLIDAGSGHPDALLTAVRDLVGDAGLDALLLTHCILPHTRNVDPIREAFDDVDVVCPALIPPVVGLDEARPHVVNDTEEIAGDRVTFMDPLLTDVVVSSWLYHHPTRTLFTAEGVGHYHAPGQCESVSTDFDGGIPADQVAAFAGDKLQFLEYVDASKLDIAFETLQAEYRIDRIAPMHGNPVAGPDVPSYLDGVVRAVESGAVAPAGD